MDFRFLWLFCRFSGALFEERDATAEAVTQFNEAHSIQRGELLGFLSCGIPLHGQRRAVEDNIAMSRFFILVAEDVWDAPPASFANEFKLALKYKADPAMPLERIALFFRRPRPDEDTDGRMAAFRQTEAAVTLPQFDFSDAADFRAQLDRLLADWLPGA